MSSSAPHDTLAANRLDPSVSADGHLSSGPGVGGQSTSQVRQEGAEHISNPLSSSSGNTSSATAASQDRVHDDGVDHIKSRLDERGATHVGNHGTTSTTGPAGVPASNPGADDPTGVTGTSQQGIVGSIKNYLGLGGEGEARRAEDVGPLGTTGTHDTYGTTSSTTGTHGTTSSTGTTHNTSSNAPGYGSTAGSTVAGAGAAAASALGYDGHSDKKESTTLPDRTRDTTAHTGSTTGGSTSGSHATDATATGSSLSAREHENTTSNSAANQAFNETGKGSSSGAVPDPSVDTSLKGHGPSATGSANEQGGNSNTEPTTAGEGAGKGGSSSSNPKSLEHPEAIPTAGGEKLGQKHWGESKIVPDIPKPTESEAGVSSHAGQPTSEVQSNTSKNTGGATSGPHGHTADTSSHSHGTTATTDEKESTIDKIKDKLHIGKK